MSQLADQQLQLSITLQKAQEILGHLQHFKNEVHAAIAELPKSSKALRIQFDAIGKEVDAIRRQLKVDMHEARGAANRIEGHVLWKATVLEIFGNEGLARCFEHMQRATTERDAIQVAAEQTA